MTMTNDERMQRESSLIATIRTKLPEFAKACADDTELVLLHQGPPRGRTSSGFCPAGVLDAKLPHL
jgi:hypothetical protein